jgi:hypothetical protein
MVVLLVAVVEERRTAEPRVLVRWERSMMAESAMRSEMASARVRARMVGDVEREVVIWMEGRDGWPSRGLLLYSGRRMLARAMDLYEMRENMLARHGID